MRKQRHKEKKKIVMHQHTDSNGNIFGKRHPANAKHKNSRTQEAHIKTI